MGGPGGRRRQPTRHDIMTPDMIRQLPAGHALIVRGAYSPVVARLGVAWKDRVYKAARRRGTAVAALTAAPALSALNDPPSTRPEWPFLPPRLTHERNPDPASVGASDEYPWS
jgi:hypothetical protein